MSVDTRAEVEGDISELLSAAVRGRKGTKLTRLYDAAYRLIAGDKFVSGDIAGSVETVFFYREMRDFLDLEY